ncbi:hypothetical protein [Exiguobacterium sp. s149]|uniref:hypothetical protein n=1 Tax=Exiguobacterium TaxID=33986 RepID=UPI00333AD1BD
MRFGIIGLGYVGLATLCGLAKAGHEVIGVEKDQPRLLRLMNGDVPVPRTGHGRRVTRSSRFNHIYGLDCRYRNGRLPRPRRRDAEQARRKL